jgi:hypothetical protein
MSFTTGESINVFISYSHDSPEHLGRVLSLSDRLRRDGIDCLIDQYEVSPRAGWPRWTMSQIEDARYVLIVCSETYHRRVRGREATGKGLGAKWEGSIITQELYDNEADGDRFIPVLFAPEDAAHIPVYLRGATRYVMDADYEKLYRHITNQPEHVKPALGTLRSLPPLDRKEEFLPTPASDVAERPARLDAPPTPPTATPRRPRAVWAFIALAGLIAIAFAVLLKLRPAEHIKTPDPPPVISYHVRVTVLDLQGAIVREAKITASVGDEPQKDSSGWEIDIPAANRPADGKVIISALKPGTDLYGQKELALGKELNLAIQIQLTKRGPASPPIIVRDHRQPKLILPTSEDTSVHIKGIVIDRSSHPVAGAWVNVVGYEKERTQTGPGGEFDLVAHAAKNRTVDLYATKEGYKPKNQSHPAGDTRMTILLAKE